MMKKYIMTLAAVLCCAMTTVFTACGNKDNAASTETQADSTALVINLDSIVIKPYMAFGSSLADVEKYMTENFADYAADGDSLTLIDHEDGKAYEKRFVNGNRQIWFDFGNADGTGLNLVSYDYFFPMPLEPVMAELERNGFVNKGEVKFDDFNADVCYLFLSADEATEVMLSSWEKDGGSWEINFQKTSEYDLNHLVKK